MDIKEYVTDMYELKNKPFVDYRGVVDWGLFMRLISVAVFSGYARGVTDMQDGEPRFSSVEEEIEKIRSELLAHYYQ